MIDVLWSSGVEIVDAKYRMPVFDQFGAQMGSKKTSAASNHYYSCFLVNVVLTTIVEMTIFNHRLRSQVIDIV